MTVNPDKILKSIIVTVILLVSLKYGFTQYFYNPYHYEGLGYSITIPEGWTKNKDQIYTGLFLTDYVDFDIVTLESPTKSKLDDEPDALITVVSAKMQTPAWIDDIFPKIMEALVQNQAKILDKGEIKVDTQISQWVLYTFKRTDQLFLEFYLADEKNGMYKIRYVAKDDAFPRYRQAFEMVRSSFKLSTALF